MRYAGEAEKGQSIRQDTANVGQRLRLEWRTSVFD